MATAILSHIETPPSYSGWDCPNNRPAAQQNRQNGCENRIVWLPCKSPNCPVCGKVWRKRRLMHYSRQFRHRPAIWIADVSIAKWPAVYARLRRAGADYVKVYHRRGAYMVFALGPVPGFTRKHPNDASSLLRRCLDLILPVARPVTASQPILPRDNPIESKWETRAVGQRAHMELLVKRLERLPIDLEASDKMVKWTAPDAETAGFVYRCLFPVGDGLYYSKDQYGPIPTRPAMVRPECLCLAPD